MKHVLKLLAYGACGALLGTLALAADLETTPRPGRSTSVPLAANAPSSYVVQRGDTLWGISSKFLTEPWYWPEIWYLNPDIQNPHRIYPGDTLRLVYEAASGRPQVRVERGESAPIRVERGETQRLSPQIQSRPLDQAIPAIPFEIVAAFMSKPSIVSKEDSKNLPYVVALPGNRVVAGMNDFIYARGLAGAQPGDTFSVVHLGEALRDPDGGGFLGYQAIYTGLARVERASAGEGKHDLAKLLLVSSARETAQGDRLIRDTLDVPLDFLPRAPARTVTGRIIAVNDGVNIIGTYQVIAINRGRRDGLAPGDVLAIWQRGESVPDRGPRTFGDDANRTFVRKVQLPEERAGTFMVFKAYESMSYGLVMSADSAIHVGDTLKNP